MYLLSDLLFDPVMLLRRRLDNRDHEEDWEAEFSRLFSTSNAACNKVAMAEGIIDVSSAEAHQRKLSFVVPAGSKDRIARRIVALGFRLTRLLSTEWVTVPSD